ncbi:hypothetical protein G7054_g14046 [Neopestalotiopsis clavispora]|nr:hypothetical protein G7054_g14046 [Neopestalotiopsis clavispora]
MYNDILSRTETGAFNATRSAKMSNAFELYHQYFTNCNDVAALGTIQAPSWVNSPEIRGTSDILWSCMLTIIACVYTALHLNIPSKGGFWRVLAIKIKWVITALLIPEIMIYMSIVQFLQARCLRNDLIEVLQELRKNGNAGWNEGRQLPSESSIDLRLCFFIDMGGIKIRPKFTQIEWDEDKRPAHHNSSTLLEDQTLAYQLTPDGVYQLLRMGYWFPVTRDLIDDKSKANNFQKGLVLLQVGWFAIQCTARKAYGLPLSLLEIHTVVHVATASIMYVFWFRKPLDIREPELWDDTTGGVLEFHTHISLLSLTLQSSLDSITIYQGSGSVNKIDRGILGVELENLYTGPILPNGRDKPRDIGMTTGVAERISASDTRHLEYIAAYIKARHAEWFRPGQTGRNLRQMIEEMRGDEYANAPIQLRSRSNLQVRKHDLDGELRFQKIETNALKAFWGLINWLTTYGRAQGKRQYENYNIFLTMFLPVIYGGIHLAAWNAAYPTMVEHIMWRAACMAIMTGLPVMLLAISPIFRFRKWTKNRRGQLWQNISDSAVLLGRCLLFTMSVLLISARCFIIVESFMSLRTAPIGVYWTPAWIQMLPHV